MYSLYHELTDGTVDIHTFSKDNKLLRVENVPAWYIGIY